MSDTMTKTALCAAVKATGSHFFDPETMRFFDSRLESGATKVGGRWLCITSEQFHGSQGSEPRVYKLRQFTFPEGQRAQSEVLSEWPMLDVAEAALEAEVQR